MSKRTTTNRDRVPLRELDPHLSPEQIAESLANPEDTTPVGEPDDVLENDLSAQCSSISRPANRGARPRGGQAVHVDYNTVIIGRGRQTGGYHHRVPRHAGTALRIRLRD